MISKFEDAQKIGAEQMEVAKTTAATFSKGMQEITAETGEYSKKSYEATQGFFTKLMEIKAVDKAIELQTDFAKQSYEGFVAHSTKVGELFTSLFKDAFRPVQESLSKAQATMSQPAATEGMNKAPKSMKAAA